MRRAAKVDANQRQMVDVLRRVGASVQPLHMVGQGCPDLLVGFRGRTVLLEVKDGAKAKSAQKLTPDEQQWHDSWRGEAYVVASVDEALKVIGAQ